MSLVYVEREFSGPTITAVAMILFLVALVACGFPGTRTTEVDPLIALRTELLTLPGKTVISAWACRATAGRASCITDIRH